MTGTLAIEVLLGAAVVLTLLSCIAVVYLSDVYESLHYLSPPSTISAAAITIAVAIEEGWGQATIKAILCTLILLLNNAVLTHATARAARIREHGQWQPLPDEKVAGREHRELRKSA